MSDARAAQTQLFGQMAAAQQQIFGPSPVPIPQVPGRNIDVGDQAALWGTIWQQYFGSDSWELTSMFEQDLHGAEYGTEITESFGTYTREEAAAKFGIKWTGNTGRTNHWVYDQGRVIGDVGARTASRISTSSRFVKSETLRTKGRAIIAPLDCAMNETSMNDLKMQMAQVAGDIRATLTVTTIDGLFADAGANRGKRWLPLMPMKVSVYLDESKNAADSALMLNKQEGAGFENAENDACDSLRKDQFNPDAVVMPTKSLQFALVGKNGSQNYNNRGPEVLAGEKNTETKIPGKNARTPMRNLEIFESSSRLMDNEKKPFNPASGIFQWGHSVMMAPKKQHSSDEYTTERLTVGMIDPDRRAWDYINADQALKTCSVWNSRGLPTTNTKKLLDALCSRVTGTAIQFNAAVHDEPDMAPHFGGGGGGGGGKGDDDDGPSHYRYKSPNDKHTFDKFDVGMNALNLIESGSSRQDVLDSFLRLKREDPAKFRKFQDIEYGQRNSTHHAGRPPTTSSSSPSSSSSQMSLADNKTEYAEFEAFLASRNVTTKTSSSSSSSGKGSGISQSSSNFEHRIELRSDQKMAFLPVFPKSYDLQVTFNGSKDDYTLMVATIASAWATVTSDKATWKAAVKSIGKDLNANPVSASETLLNYARMCVVAKEIDLQEFVQRTGSAESGTPEDNYKDQIKAILSGQSLVEFNAEYGKTGQPTEIGQLFGKMTSRFREFETLFHGHDIDVMEAVSESARKTQTPETRKVLKNFVRRVINLRIQDEKSPEAKNLIDVVVVEYNKDNNYSEKRAVWFKKAIETATGGSAASDSDSDDDGSTVNTSKKRAAGKFAAGTVTRPSKRVKTGHLTTDAEELAIIKRMLYRTRLTYAFFDACLKHNIYPFFKFKLWQLYIRINAMHLLFFCKGDKTAINIVTNQTLRIAEMHSSGGVRIDTRFSLGMMVLNSKRLYLHPFAFCDTIEGGHGLKFYDHEQHFAAFTSGLFPADIITCIQHIDDNEEGISNFCVLHDPTVVVDQAVPGKTTQEAYAEVWGLRKPQDRSAAPTEWGPTYFRQRAFNRHQTKAFTAPHLSWRPNELDGSKGSVVHFEAGVGPLGPRADTLAWDMLKGIARYGSVKTADPTGTAR